jgi:Uma2 family endonuclease
VLPNGARRSPDASWIKLERWNALTAEEQEGFAPLCPDFVIELRSRSDNLPPLEDKMLEYIANGAQMAWLIDPLRKRVYIYRPNRPKRDVEILEDPETVSGDPELSGFKLNVRELW